MHRLRIPYPRPPCLLNPVPLAAGSALEAMSAGLPVVASDLPVFREYLRPGRDALMVPVNDAGALAAALASVLGDEALADRLRAAGHAVSARFTWAASAAEHQAIYASAR